MNDKRMMTLDGAKGSWALVTGASSGIGEEFCRQLAAAGMGLVMVARREARLVDLAEQLERQHNVPTRILPIDLSRPNAAEQVKTRLDAVGVRIRLLCNNAGAGHLGKFVDGTLDEYERMVLLNTYAMVSLCHVLLADLTSHSSSVIINVSSQAAFQPVPFMAVYAATKAFVHNFSQALYGELNCANDANLLVQTLVPGPTETEFDQNAGAYDVKVGKRQSPHDVVRASLAHLGKDRPIVSNVRGNYVQRLMAAMAPAKLAIRTTARMFKPTTMLSAHQL